MINTGAHARQTEIPDPKSLNISFKVFRVTTPE